MRNYGQQNASVSPFLCNVVVGLVAKNYITLQE